MKNVKVALMPDNTCAFSCFPCLTILPMKQCGSDFSDLGFSFPFEIQHHFWNNNSHQHTKKSIFLTKPPTLQSIAGRKIDGKDNRNEKEQPYFINLQNYHILKISKSYHAIKTNWRRQNTFLFVFHCNQKPMCRKIAPLDNFI